MPKARQDHDVLTANHAQDRFRTLAILAPNLVAAADTKGAPAYPLGDNQKSRDEVIHNIVHAQSIPNRVCIVVDPHSISTVE